MSKMHLKIFTLQAACVEKQISSSLVLNVGALSLEGQ